MCISISIYRLTGICSKSIRNSFFQKSGKILFNNFLDVAKAAFIFGTKIETTICDYNQEYE